MPYVPGPGLSTGKLPLMGLISLNLSAVPNLKFLLDFLRLTHCCPRLLVTLMIRTHRHHCMCVHDGGGHG